MNYQLRCVECSQLCWASGEDEPDVNACSIDLDTVSDDACEHILAGGDFEVVDAEFADIYD